MLYFYDLRKLGSLESNQARFTLAPFDREPPPERAAKERRGLRRGEAGEERLPPARAEGPLSPPAPRGAPAPAAIGPRPPPVPAPDWPRSAAARGRGGPPAGEGKRSEEPDRRERAAAAEGGPARPAGAVRRPGGERGLPQRLSHGRRSAGERAGPGTAGAVSFSSSAEVAPCLETSTPAQRYGQKRREEENASADPRRERNPSRWKSGFSQPATASTLRRDAKRCSSGNLDAFCPPEQLVSCDSLTLQVKVTGIFHR